MERRRLDCPDQNAGVSVTFGAGNWKFLSALALRRSNLSVTGYGGAPEIPSYSPFLNFLLTGFENFRSFSSQPQNLNFGNWARFELLATKMGWNYPDISLEKMMELIKGFIDILILASGYQSSGRLAHWDAHNIKQAFQWGLFFEHVLSQLSRFEIHEDSIEALDEEISKIKSNPSFPQGLAHLSSATLGRASGFVSEHLIQKLPLRDSHLRAYLEASIEMDLIDLMKREHDSVGAYLNNLRGLNIFPPDVASIINVDKCDGDNFTNFAVHELHERQHAVLCILAVEVGLDMVSDAVRCSCLGQGRFNKEQLKQEEPPCLAGIVKPPVDLVTWNCWKSRALSYFLDKRTIRLVSGASLIFSGARSQWMRVFEQLSASKNPNGEDFQELFELLLLGCTANRWNDVLELFMPVSYVSISITRQYYTLRSCLVGGSETCCKGNTNSKELDILDYVTALFGDQLHLLWKLPPVMAAVALPSWSLLFQHYLLEIESQLKGNWGEIRCCSCFQEGKDHNECELGERIWCLYIFHSLGSQVRRCTSIA